MYGFVFICLFSLERVEQREREKRGREGEKREIKDRERYTYSKDPHLLNCFRIWSEVGSGSGSSIILNHEQAQRVSKMRTREIENRRERWRVWSR